MSRYILDNELVQAYLAWPLGEATPEALIAFADEFFDGLERDELVALANAMTPEEIESLFDIIHGVSLAVNRNTAQYVTLLYYVCNENIPFDSVQGYEASRARHAFAAGGRQVRGAHQDRPERL